MGEGRAARKAGGGTPLKDPAGRARARILLSRRRLAPSLAEVAGLPEGNAPAGFARPARAKPLGGGVPRPPGTSVSP